MKLIECYIENFGKLSDYKYNFSAGINSIKEDNGYGKTTLSVFIKAMFFGLDDTKRAKLESNDRKHYLPWNGQVCRGSLTFMAKGRKYRIERTFMPKAQDDLFKLYDCNSGKESFDYSERIGEELFSIDADGFERTLFLSEANISGKNDNKTVSAKLSDLVGYDGDVEAMDEAIELLEKQRKTYHRRGGAGEIGEIRKKISEITMEINDLTRKKDSYIAEEAKLSAIISELDELYKERVRLEKEARIAEAHRIKEGYERQYREMKESVDAETSKLEVLDKFFACGIPTAAEIEDAKDKLSEAKRLESNRTESQDAEFVLLDGMFSGRKAEIFERAEEVAEALDGLERERELLKREREALKNGGNTSHAPDLSTVDELINSLLSAKKKKKPSPILPILGTLIIGAAVGLGFAVNPLCYLLIIAGILLFIPTVISLLASDGSAILKDNRVRARILIEKSGYPTPKGDSELINALYLIRQTAGSSINAQKRVEMLVEKIEEATENIGKAHMEACEIIASFGLEARGDVKDGVRELVRKWELYKILLEREGHSADAKERKLLVAKKLRAEVDTFLSRFPTTSASPFEEISQKSIEYSYLTRTIKNMNANLSEFKIQHGLSDAPDEQREPVVAVDPTALNERILELEQKKAVSERECRIMSEEIERIDELYVQKEELAALSDQYRKKLDVILKTEEYLKEAKDSITTKYLSKTKAAFLKYLDIMSDEGEFSMDTSFTVMKNERGTLRPAEAYSRGTRDLYALAIRLALIDSLYENEEPFIVLDDPFAHFDDEKTQRAIDALIKIGKEKQIIYFTCADSRKIPSKKRI